MVSKEDIDYWMPVDQYIDREHHSSFTLFTFFHESQNTKMKVLK